MQTRRLGYTDLELTTVGLGTWAMGGPWEYGWGPQDDSQAIAAIRRAIDEGINWIDTAPVYGVGHSEELIGSVLQELGVKPIVATKCGLLWNEKKQKLHCLKPKSIRAECHDSLKRLGIEVIDLYQIHWPIPDEDVESAWEELAGLVREGKVRYLGASNFSLDQLERVQRVYPVASLQNPYSMLHREVEDGLLAYCAGNNIGVITYSPMQRGLLTGRFSPERLAMLAADDHRRRNPDFLEPRFSAALQLVEGLKRMAARFDRPVSQLAISWVLRRPEVTAAIVGARAPAQIAETAPAAGWALDEEVVDGIEQLLVEFEQKVHV